MAKTAWRNLSLWKKLGSNLKSVRKWKSLTESQVSEGVGIDLKKYRRMERGQTEYVTLKEIVDIINLFGVLTEEIIPF